MHLNAMSATPPYADESHVEQDITMIIVGIEQDNLKEAINGKTKAAITLQCKEMLGNKGSVEGGYIWGSRTVKTTNTDNWSNNPRRTWCNTTFISALPEGIKPLIKTVIKKNLANHTDSTAGPDTEDKVFLASGSEMFGNQSYQGYKGNSNSEGEQYSYYNSSAKTKTANNNGNKSTINLNYWLRSPSSYDDNLWIIVNKKGEFEYSTNDYNRGLAPSFCL